MIRRNRNWVILRHEGGNLWRQITAISAPTRRMAIDRATQGDDNPFNSTGTFKAIPAKAWAHEIVKEAK